ncbi:MAG: cell division ATP-binding protein FtsE [Finegoldia sp.]|nr:cell division ATP-binding protein FtsE [Finegoldia sp.]
MIEFSRVSKTYNKKVRALDNVSFHIKKGEFVFIIGPSGAGKSTLTKLILKEERPTSGRIYVNGKNISKMRSWEIPKYRQKMGVVFQDFRILEDKTVEGNIRYAMELLGKSNSYIKRTISDTLSLLNLEGKEKSYPYELSGGELQRVSIARAMASNPEILIADEPTGNLDPVTSMKIAKTLEKINDKGTTVLMITHEAAVVNALNKRVIQLDQGRLIRDEFEGKYFNGEN